MGIWFNPLRKFSNISFFIIFQNKYLRLIESAFKATPSFLLESELFFYPYISILNFAQLVFYFLSKPPL